MIADPESFGGFHRNVIVVSDLINKVGGAGIDGIPGIVAWEKDEADQIPCPASFIPASLILYRHPGNRLGTSATHKMYSC